MKHLRDLCVTLDEGDVLSVKALDTRFVRAELYLTNFLGVCIRFPRYEVVNGVGKVVESDKFEVRYGTVSLPADDFIDACGIADKMVEHKRGTLNLCAILDRCERDEEACRLATPGPWLAPVETWPEYDPEGEETGNTYEDVDCVWRGEEKGDDGVVCLMYGCKYEHPYGNAVNNARFIAAAREALEEATNDRRELLTEVGILRQVLAQAMWYIEFIETHDGYCEVCGSVWGIDNPPEHEKDCIIEKIRGAL
jgi:hypothetical protein